MDYRVYRGFERNNNFIREVYDLDVAVYPRALAGVIDAMYDRYQWMPDSFLLLYCGDELAGYINFFPVCEELYDSLTDPEDMRMRDDDIKPYETEGYRLDRPADLFIISVVIAEKYRDGEAIRELSVAFLDYRREKEENGYFIGSISGIAVSEDGTRFLSRLRAEQIKQYDGGYKLMISRDDNIRRLIDDGFRFD